MLIKQSNRPNKHQDKWKLIYKITRRKTLKEQYWGDGIKKKEEKTGIIILWNY